MYNNNKASYSQLKNINTHMPGTVGGTVPRYGISSYYQQIVPSNAPVAPLYGHGNQYAPVSKAYGTNCGVYSVKECRDMPAPGPSARRSPSARSSPAARK